MTEKRPHQYTFGIDLQGMQLNFPQTDILTLPEIVFLFPALEKRAIWQSRGEKPFLLADLRHNLAAVSGKKGWQQQQPYEEVKLKQGSLSAVILITGSQNGETLSKFEETIKQATFYLPQHQGSLFILEEKGEDYETQARKNILAKAGLVKANVLKPRSQPYLLWEGRRPKEHEPVDLTIKDDFWKTLNAVCYNYEQSGFDVVVPNSKGSLSFVRLTQVLDQIRRELKQGEVPNFPLPRIIERSQECGNPPQTIAVLIDGFGLTLRNKSCDRCTWQIDTNGTQQKVISCDNPDHEGISPEISPSVYKYIIGSTKSNEICTECFLDNAKDPRLTTSISILEPYLYRSEILELTTCDHHGDIYRRKDFVLNAQIGFKK